MKKQERTLKYRAKRPFFYHCSLITFDVSINYTYVGV